MYTKYENILKQKYGLDFNYYVDTIRRFGNESGIYADVALLLFELASNKNTSSVLEFGSGMSTMVLASARSRSGFSLLTLEHSFKWYNITKNCLYFFGDADFDYVCTDNSVDRFPVLQSSPSLVWVDGSLLVEKDGEFVGRIGACEYYWGKMKSSYLLFDDAQCDILLYENFLSAKGRDLGLNFMFNPTGRMDRHVLVSPPYEHHPYTEIVKCLM